MNILYPLIAVIIVSSISVLFAIPFFFKKKIPEKFLVFLLSISVGVLLAAVFMNFFPEIYAHAHEEDLTAAFVIMLGFLVMFILEKFVHYHHKHKEEKHHGHAHAYNLAPINLIGDAVHNFIDGLVIAGSFAVNAAVGIAATVAIIFHEIPQEIADFGVLLYSGMSKKKALIFNALSATTAIIGTIIGILLIGRLEGFTEFVIPFAAGNFLYIAAANLVPQLHRHCGFKDTIIHVLAIVLGIAIIALVTLFGPSHVH